MARLPDALERRDVLYGRARKRGPGFFKGLGDDYREVGRLSDACEAYEKLEDEDERQAALRGVREQAIAEGDQFVLNRIDARSGQPLSEAEWRQALGAARAAGKLRYAHKIAQRIGDAELVAELEGILGIDRPTLPELEGEGEQPQGEPEPDAQG